MCPIGRAQVREADGGKHEPDFVGGLQNALRGSDRDDARQQLAEPLLIA
jgi:hypothetical protein